MKISHFAYALLLSLAMMCSFSSTTMAMEAKLPDNLIKDELLKEQCAICLETYEESSKPITILRCLNGVYHRFHNECLAPILAGTKKCPICRAALNADGSMVESKQNKAPIFQHLKIPTLIDLLLVGALSSFASYYAGCDQEKAFLIGGTCATGLYLGSAKTSLAQNISIHERFNGQKYGLGNRMWLSNFLCAGRLLRIPLWGAFYALANAAMRQNGHIAEFGKADFIAGSVIGLHQEAIAAYARIDSNNSIGKAQVACLFSFLGAFHYRANRA